MTLTPEIVFQVIGFLITIITAIVWVNRKTQKNESETQANAVRIGNLEEKLANEDTHIRREVARLKQEIAENTSRLEQEIKENKESFKVSLDKIYLKMEVLSEKQGEMKGIFREVQTKLDFIADNLDMQYHKNKKRRR